ncbi:hypothetical protein MRX96_059518 [Rhipicephalus microplus]
MFYGVGKAAPARWDACARASRSSDAREYVILTSPEEGLRSHDAGSQSHNVGPTNVRHTRHARTSKADSSLRTRKYVVFLYGRGVCAPREEKRDGENRRVMPVDAPNALGRGRDGALTANPHRDDLALP